MSVDFDPDGPGDGDGLFGLSEIADPAVRVIAVPWEATASYGRGTARAPSAIEAASQQVDLYDLQFGPIWKHGIAWDGAESDAAQWNREASTLALEVIEAGGVNGDPRLMEMARQVDALSDRRDAWVRGLAEASFDAGCIPAVVGGDHSSPLGLLEAVAERHPGVGILHIDAHADLRVAYLGFRSSHASIMHRALECEGIGGLVGVGYRDVGAAEVECIDALPERIVAYTDFELSDRLAQGETWAGIAGEIAGALPSVVHISLDIDGLDPSLCPNTGTPVPGGLTFRHLCTLLEAISTASRVVSFDLCEVAPGDAGEWDANVGARVLYKLAGCALTSKARG
jgi:agmatinase